LGISLLLSCLSIKWIFMGNINIYSRLASGATTIFFTCALLFLGGCLGGGGGEETTINGLSVPIEPDSLENNATLAGVDGNNNGVRDDVERKIAENWPQDYNGLIASAATYQKILTNTPITEEEDKSTFCFLANSKISSEELTSLILNSTERHAAYANNVGAKKFWECQS
jgi:hypothetical protein